jgi:hypothetical protein
VLARLSSTVPELGTVPGHGLMESAGESQFSHTQEFCKQLFTVGSLKLAIEEVFTPWKLADSTRWGCFLRGQFASSLLVPVFSYPSKARLGQLPLDPPAQPRGWPWSLPKPAHGLPHSFCYVLPEQVL